jgi:hypothetical protein
MRTSVLSLAAALAAGFFLAQPLQTAFGDPIAYEGFAYQAGGGLVGNGGGSGFVGVWHPGGYNASAFSNYDVSAGSLAYGSLPTSGNRASAGARTELTGTTRDLATP